MTTIIQRTPLERGLLDLPLNDDSFIIEKTAAGEVGGAASFAAHILAAILGASFTLLVGVASVAISAFTVLLLIGLVLSNV